jgi:acyl carrier protein
MSPGHDADTRDNAFRVVRDHLRFLDPGEPLPADASLRALGLDSLAAIDLLLDLERTFGVVFPDELLTEETFRTATRIASAVVSLTRSTGER